MIYLLSVLLVVQTIALAFSTYFAIKFGRIILSVQDSVEDSLDILDKRYASISRVLQIPLFYDSPEIKRVHEDIKACKDTVLQVANLIGRIEDVKEGDDEG